jgi:hypothetical protein
MITKVYDEKQVEKRGGKARFGQQGATGRPHPCSLGLTTYC